MKSESHARNTDHGPDQERTNPCFAEVNLLYFFCLFYLLVVHQRHASVPATLNQAG
jgi:hypothetical protein